MSWKNVPRTGNLTCGVEATRVIWWDVFDPAHSCCLSVLKNFRVSEANGKNPDGVSCDTSKWGTVYVTPECTTCHMYWIKCTGREDDRWSRPYQVVETQFFKRRCDVPRGWVIIKDQAHEIKLCSCCE